MSVTHKTHFISLDLIGIKGDLSLIVLENKNIPSSEWDEGMKNRPEIQSVHFFLFYQNSTMRQNLAPLSLLGC